MSKKVYAKQVSPESQGDFLYDVFEYDEYSYDISVCGNGNFSDRKTEVFERVENVLNSAEVFYALEEAGSGYSSYKNKSEVIYDYLPREDGKRYNNKDIHDLVKCIERYNDTYRSADLNNIMCEALTIVARQEYDWKTIRRCCQGDWNYIFYPVEEYSNNYLHSFETMYFNTGSEWIIHDSDSIPESAEDIDGYSMYCVTYDVQKEIAEAEGVNPEDVVLYEYHERRQPYYTVATA